jgi:hypothetical protein
VTAILALAAGCAEIDMPKVDLSDPQWRVNHGQALWKPASGRLELTGDLVVAENANDDVWVNMTKSLLPIFTARTWENTWSIEFVQRAESYQGRGRPPVKRFIWFDLPDILQGAAPPRHWQVSKSDGQLALRNSRTGEEIRMVFE